MKVLPIENYPYHSITDVFTDLSEEGKWLRKVVYRGDFTRTKHEVVDKVPPPKLPKTKGGWSVVTADPPWRYKDCGYNGYQDVQKYRIHCSYPTMTERSLLAFSELLGKVAHPKKSAFYLWVTKDFLPLGYRMIEAAGFEHKTQFIWLKTTSGLSKSHAGLEEFSKEELQIAETVIKACGLPGKPSPGMGYYGRNCHEILLYATRGNVRPVWAPITSSVIAAPRLKHSAKPTVFYDLIRLGHDGKKLATFERKNRAGFTVWGDEI